MTARKAHLSLHYIAPVYVKYMHGLKKALDIIDALSYECVTEALGQGKETKVKDAWARLGFEKLQNARAHLTGPLLGDGINKRQKHEVKENDDN